MSVVLFRTSIYLQKKVGLQYLCFDLIRYNSNISCFNCKFSNHRFSFIDLNIPKMKTFANIAKNCTISKAMTLFHNHHPLFLAIINKTHVHS